MTCEEKEVFIQAGVPLGATVAGPGWDGRHPAIVIVMGTGELDRDGNGKGVRTDFYKGLAELFADAGFVSVRYDKRNTHRSGKSDGASGLDDLVDDAIAVTRYAKGLQFVDEGRVVVCGHSEGAIIATLLSQREDTAGLILLGGAGTSLRDALYYQNREVAEEAGGTKGLKWLLLRGASDAEKNCAKVDALFAKCSGTDADKVFFNGARMNAKWLREHGSHSSEELIAILKGYGRPVLAITGTADVSMDSSRLSLLEGIPEVECYAPEGVNHMLREIDDDNSMLKVKKQYVRLAKSPIHRGTEERIRTWLSRFL